MNLALIVTMSQLKLSRHKGVTMKPNKPKAKQTQSSVTINKPAQKAQHNTVKTTPKLEKTIQSAQGLIKTSAAKLISTTLKATPTKKEYTKSQDSTPKNNHHFRVLKSGLNALTSFQTSGIEANIKYKKRKDIALIFSAYPCIAAGVFTRNKVRAACVDYNIKAIQKNPIHAIVINSGNANACTGDQGIKACDECARAAGAALGVESSSVLLASTGVIGVQLPVPNMIKGIGLLAQTKSASRQSAKDAASAILTTDTTPKEAAVEFMVHNKKVRLAGIAKGSGMIHPNMATMLCFLVTNLNITPKLLQKALNKNVKESFNMISVDGDTSTNDMVLLLANGRANNPIISDPKDKNYQIFKKALQHLMIDLARKIARDGEGANKLITARVENAINKKDARKLAKAMIASNLVKTAMFGNDANWGRIVCAIGASGANFDSKKICLSFISKGGKIQILKNGVAQNFDEKQAKKILAQKEIEIVLDCKSGSKSASAWGCDLSYEYVRINASYRS